MKKDITAQLQRLESFEERMCVRLEALYAETHENQNGYWITVNGELHPQQGTQVSENMRIVIDACDTSGRVVCTADDLVWSEKFFGFESFSITLNVPVPDIAKLRIYPKPY